MLSTPMNLSAAKFFVFFFLFLFAPLLSQGSEYASVNKTSEGAYEYVVFRKDVPLGRQIKKEHAIYVIKYDFNLRGDTLQMPSECILKFEGGHLKNGSIVFDNTIIESTYSDVFSQIAVGGSISNREVWLSWWKLEYNLKSNDAVLINQIIEAVDNCILFYDIQNNVYVGTDYKDGRSEETIEIKDKRNLRIIQTTDNYTILRGRSTLGAVVRCINNKFITINGMKIDGGNVYYKKWGENGIGVVGNEKAIIENCVIKNCYSNCFDETAKGQIQKNGYPSWGSGGKGVQVEGGNISIQATIRNNSISNCYIGISNNASDQESVLIEGNFIDSCYMSLVLLRLARSIKMSVNIDNTTITNNTGDVGVICMGDVENVSINNTQVSGKKKIQSILRGCFSYSDIQLIVNQQCFALIDAALFRDNPEGNYASKNHVIIISQRSCDNIISTSEIIPKQGGLKYATYLGGDFDISVEESINKTPIALPYEDNTSNYKVRVGEKIMNGKMIIINSINK